MSKNLLWLLPKIDKSLAQAIVFWAQFDVKQKKPYPKAFSQTNYLNVTPQQAALKSQEEVVRRARDYIKWQGPGSVIYEQFQQLIAAVKERGQNDE